MDLSAATSFAEETALAAGEVLLAHDDGKPSPPRMKGVRDPVTEADLASERLIVGRIREAFPDTAICAEEETRDRPDERPTWFSHNRLWLSWIDNDTARPIGVPTCSEGRFCS